MTCFASSSKGNCYLLELALKQKVLIETGLSYAGIRYQLLAEGVLISDISVCLVSHGHKDHSRGIHEIARMIPTYANVETIRYTNCKETREIKEFEPIVENDIEITAFSVPHDLLNFGFIIKTASETILYVNDAKLVEWDLSTYKFTHIMIECNYNDNLLGNDATSIRTLNNHMSLTTTVKTLHALDLTQCRAIYLLHLSDTNSDQQIMLSTIIDKFKKTTYVCNKYGGIKEGEK